MVIEPHLSVFNERFLRDNPFHISQLHGKSVTLVYSHTPAYNDDKAWESLAAVGNDDGKVYVLISREAQQ